MKKKVLVICYNFPPNPGVGGRKWAKVTKYLNRTECEVFVLCRKPTKNSISPWDEDVKKCNIIYYRSLYPNILTIDPKNYLQKILYKLSILFLKLFTSGNYYDRACIDKITLYPKVIGILSKYDIRNVIVTGGPFNLLYFCSELKVKNPTINLISDLRDPWINENYFGFGLLGEKRQAIEKNKFDQVLKNTDKLIVPLEIMATEILSANKEFENKLIIHPHAVDLEIIQPRQKVDNYKRLVNFGSQYNFLHDLMVQICLGIKGTDIEIDLYTDDFKYLNIYKENNVLDLNICYKKPVTEREVYEIMSQCGAVLLYVNEKFKNQISTKFYEAAAARVPIVLISDSGLCSEFVIDNKIGIHIEFSEVRDKIEKIPLMLKELNYNYNFEINYYSFEKISTNTAKLLN
jgi:glycosyltransferase involved in cell wall biosynthesis